MAGIIKRASGTYTVRVMIGNDRRTVALGTKSEPRAQRASEFIQDLATCRETGEIPEKPTKQWLSNQGVKIKKRLAELGLVESSAAVDHPKLLGDFVQDYIDRFGPAKDPSTVTTWKQCERLLLEHFPADKPLAAITAGDAEDFRNHLLTRKGDLGGKREAKPLAEATVRKRCGCAKGFLNHAIAKGIIDSNPFDNPKVPTTSPRGKQKEFIPTTVAEKIRDEFPTAEWRLLFSLARWGGMRVPSEPENLRWSDIDFDRQRINFRTPKTDHHDGLERREIPIFPELEKPLQDVYDQENSSEYVLPMLRSIAGSALVKPLEAALKRAHVKRWKKLWNALRASRRTELLELWPSHVVDAWMGHDKDTGDSHYSQVLDEHFERATKNVTISRPAQTSTGSHGEQRNAKTPHNRAHRCTGIKQGSPGGTRTDASFTDENCETSPARSNNVTISAIDDDPRLALVVDRWPDLPESVREEVAALVTAEANRIE